MTAPDVIGDALVRAFADRGFQATLPRPTRLQLHVPDPSSPIDIAEWRAFAGRNSRADLPEIAASFVEGFVRKAGPVLQGTARLAQHAEIARTLDADRLRVRLYPEDALTGDMAAALVTRRLAPGLLETVVVDYPDAVMTLNRSDTGGLPPEQVFGAAVAASVGREEHYVQTDDFQNVPIMHVGGTHRYVSAHVHVLRRHVDPATAPYGALVALPVPEYVVVHVIGRATHLFWAMETMQDLAARHHEAGEKAITPQLYWWRPGAYEQLPEEHALSSGMSPDLRPVGIDVDHEAQSVAARTAETDELIGLWMRDHG
ncbi:hypothetical protein [Actinomadura hibisca]|uniref:hypothetical protein n=1 Tax=Actinomadura hibisca TaxID=68565 RepID=UPI00082FFA01|nr:hypothetical protein [Actinomadura hibisca]